MRKTSALATAAVIALFVTGCSAEPVKTVVDQRDSMMDIADDALISFEDVTVLSSKSSYDDCGDDRIWVGTVTFTGTDLDGHEDAAREVLDGIGEDGKYSLSIEDDIATLELETVCLPAGE